MKHQMMPVKPMKMTLSEPTPPVIPSIKSNSPEALVTDLIDFARAENLFPERELTGGKYSILSQIIAAESGYTHTATNKGNKNGSVDRGIYQINSIHISKETPLTSYMRSKGYDIKKNPDLLYNPRVNMMAASHIYRSRGNNWGAWAKTTTSKINSPRLKQKIDILWQS